MKNIAVYGMVSLAVSLDVQAKEKEQGLNLAQRTLNSFTSNLDTVTFNFFDREPVTVSVHDFDSAWESIFDDEE